MAKIPRTFRIDKDLYQKLELMADSHNLTPSSFIELACYSFLGESYKKVDTSRSEAERDKRNRTNRIAVYISASDVVYKELKKSLKVKIQRLVEKPILD